MIRLRTIATGLWLATAVPLAAHAQTTPASPAPATPNAAVAPPTAANPTPAVPAKSPAKPSPGATSAGGKPAGAKSAGGTAGAKGSASRAMDRLDLDTTQITGNRELPKVMVVVPWKKSDIGDLVGKPVNSLIDEALEPVDREVFRREVDYYGALSPDRPAGGSAAASRSETAVTPEAGAPRPEK
jgi:hypothetical protein